jgi:hypothetical protein
LGAVVPNVRSKEKLSTETVSALTTDSVKFPAINKNRSFKNCVQKVPLLDPILRQMNLVNKMAQ